MGGAPQGWTEIIQRVTADPYAKAYTIFDILNEPDAVNLRWQPYSGSCPGGTCPGVRDLYHRIMQIGNKINTGAPTGSPPIRARARTYLAPAVLYAATNWVEAENKLFGSTASIIKVSDSCGVLGSYIVGTVPLWHSVF